MMNEFIIVMLYSKQTSFCFRCKMRGKCWRCWWTGLNRKGKRCFFCDHSALRTNVNATGYCGTFRNWKTCGARDQDVCARVSILFLALQCNTTSYSSNRATGCLHRCVWKILHHDRESMNLNFHVPQKDGWEEWWNNIEDCQCHHYEFVYWRSIWKQGVSCYSIACPFT